MKLTSAMAFCLWTMPLLAKAATSSLPTKATVPAVTAQIPAVAERGPLVTPNTIRAATLQMNFPSAGTIVRFNISGRPASTNAKCVVAVTFDRAANAIHPKPASITKEYAFELHAGIPTQLDTASTNEGGDWIFKLRPVRDCTGDEYVFQYTVPFGSNETAAVILGVGPASGTPQIPLNGQSVSIDIIGSGDLKNCKVEFGASGGWGMPGGFATKVLSMNGQLKISETVVVNFPVLNQPGFLPASSTPAYLEVKPLSGCALASPHAENKLKATYSVMNSLQ